MCGVSSPSPLLSPKQSDWFGEWVCKRPFAFVTLNIAVENIQHATHRPSVSERDDPKNVPLNITKAKPPRLHTQRRKGEALQKQKNRSYPNKDLITSIWAPRRNAYYVS